LRSRRSTWLQDADGGANRLLTAATIDVTTKIRDRYGISLDWIYCGDQRALPSDLYQKLASIAA